MKENNDALKALKQIKVCVHNGPMHSDEVFAVAVLSIINQDNIEIIRTRDPEIMKQCDIRIDVGDNYNHHTKDYDHHMQWFMVRHKPPYKKRLADGAYREFKEGPLRSGFGLIWLHYGLEVVTQIIKEAYPEKEWERFTSSDILDMYESYDDGFVAYIDAVDNGETNTFYLNESPFRGSDITKLVSGFNPTISEQRHWKEHEQTDARYLEQFKNAVNLAIMIVKRDIVKHSELLFYRADFMKLISEMKNDQSVLVLEEYIPWFYAYGRAGAATNGVEMIVYPTNNAGWMCQTPYYYQKRDGDVLSPYLKDGSQRRYKHQAPEAICGLKDEELVSATGLKDVTFVHKGGHLGAASTKEAAIELAQYFIEKGRN